MVAESGRQGKVLAVVNRKGGVAKTTTAINLAHGLSRKLILKLKHEDVGKVQDTSRLYQYLGRHYYIEGHVLLVDFDPQGHCARGLGIEVGEADIGQVLLGRQHLSHAVVSADRSAEGFPRPNLWLLPASDNLEQAKEELRRYSLAQLVGKNEGKDQELLNVLRQRLSLVVKNFSFVILDCPPAMDVFVQAIYHFADAAIVPVKPDYFSMAGTGQHMADIRDAQLRGIDIEIQVIVPTFTVKQQRLDREMVATLRKHYGELVGEPIPRSQAVAEAPAYRQTIFEFDPRFRNPATVAYQKLVDRIYHG
ncbi:MAG TPA: ParA family protein [Anaerolineae bacterium]